MPDDLIAPTYSYASLRIKAEEFLAKYHPAGDIPIPIESIVEFQFEIDIIPVPGLFDVLDTDGFVTGDLSSIYVDEYIYSHRQNRYRFTLAHEIGHAVLHADLFRSVGFQSIEEWKHFVNSTPNVEYTWLEQHANAFAGLILVPRNKLDAETKNCLELAESNKIDLHKNADFLWSHIADQISKRFEVSSTVIGIRLEKDGLRPSA